MAGGTLSAGAGRRVGSAEGEGQPDAAVHVGSRWRHHAVVQGLGLYLLLLFRLLLLLLLLLMLLLLLLGILLSLALLLVGSQLVPV